MAAPIAAGEEMILATECNTPDRAFNRVGVEFDTAIVQEARQTLPARERVADRFGQGAASRQQRELRFEPEPHRLGDGLRSIAESREPVRRRLTANLGFDGIEFGDPAQRLGRDRRVGRLRHLMAPASREHDVARAGQGLEASIAVHAQNAPEVFEMRPRPIQRASNAGDRRRDGRRCAIADRAACDRNIC
jgi:hypothetical protein